MSEPTAPVESPTPIENIPTETINVTSQHVEAKTKIGTEEFNKEFSKQICSGALWRTPSSLAKSLGVDTVDLAKWMDKQPALCHRPSKEEGTYYYALVQRLEKDKDKEEKKTLPETRKPITEEDRYCVAQLSMLSGLYTKFLEKYAIRIHDHSPEAFTACLNARDRLGAAVAMMQESTKANGDKLLKL